MGDETPFIPPSFKAIIEVLNRRRVRYVVIGGVAGLLHGVPLERTFDVDVTPASDAKNLKRLTGALRELEAKLRVPGLDYGVAIPLDERTFSKMTTVTFVTQFGPFDVCIVPDGTAGYEDLIRDAEVVDVEGESVPLMSLADIERSKRAAGRAKDVEHLRILMQYRRRRGG